MQRLLKKRGFRKYAALAAVLAGMAGLIAYPAESAGAARDGLSLCFNAVIPSLFPFFVLSSLAVDLGLAGCLGRICEPVMRPLFNVNGACAGAFALGFVGGYPVGAKTAISLYEKGYCSREEAERLLSFCNNSGPAFILGVVGSAVFANGRAGLLLYLAHTAASILIGILFRFYKRGAPAGQRRGVTKIRTVRLTAAFIEAVKSSFRSILNICAFVVFFTVIIKLLFLSGLIPAAAKMISAALSPFGVDQPSAQRLLTGAVELSSGVWSLKDAEGSIAARLAMAAFMLGWAGISVHFQVLSFIGESGLNSRTYVIGKLLHGVLSAVFAWWLAMAFHFEAPVASYLAEQVHTVTTLDFGSALSLSLRLSGAIFALFILLFSLSASPRSRRKTRVRAGRAAQEPGFHKKHWKNG